MIKELDRYGAVCAKVRGMYGKRLTREDWARLSAASQVDQLVEILGRTPGWGPLPEGLRPEKLKGALEERVRSEYAHLQHFVQLEADKKYMGYFLQVKEPLAADAAGYRKAWEYLFKDYKGLSAVTLRKMAGTEADLLNVTYLLRLRRFPEMKTRAQDYLIPVHLELTGALARQILDAPDEETARRALHGTHMAAIFADRSDSPEALCRVYLENFCRKLVTLAEPSLAVPAAYLTLKQMECRKLDRLIEVLRLGMDPGKTL